MISIIIATCNRDKELKRNLAALENAIRQAPPGFVTQLIVTADGDVPHLPSTSFPVTAVQGPRRGPAANRNFGSSLAHGEWLLFLDDDCIPEHSLLSGYAAAMQEYPEIEVFEGRISSEGARTSLDQTAPLNESGGYLWSCNFAIRSALFRSISGFSELFQYPCMEDVELRTRLDKYGARPCFVPDAAVVHPWRSLPGWSYYQRHFESTLLFRSLHVEQRERINSRYYLRLAVYGFLKSTLPGVFRYRGKGFRAAMRQHLAFLAASVRLAYE